MQSANHIQHTFARTPQIGNIPRSVFDRSRNYKTTLNADYLYPVFFDEVLPGDTVSLKTAMFSRMLSALTVPMMDNMYINIHYWYVPLRILQTNFVKIMGEQDNPGDSISYLAPAIAAPVGGFTEGSLQDYMGLPTKIASTSSSLITLYHFRAYNQIWNYFYRDENLQNSVPQIVADSGDNWSDYVLLKRGKRHDYFTSSLPFAQKGDAVTMPLGTTAPIIGLGKANRTYSLTNQNVYETDATSTVQYPNAFLIGPSTDNNLLAKGDASNNGKLKIYADLSSAGAPAINSIRTAVTMQQYLERNARGGTRFVELIPSHFGVTVPDFRLSKPEFLGSSGGRVGVKYVPQTSNTPVSGTPQGNLSAYAESGFFEGGFNKSFVEHGVILGLLSINADLNYQQGLHKMWSRRGRFDFYWPTFANVGEQTVKLRELYFQDTSADDSDFGWQEYASEYRYAPNIITGQLRANATTPLTMWHLVQNFGSPPTLNSTFIQSSTPTSQIKAVTTSPDFIVDLRFDTKWIRPIPAYSVPGLLRF